MMLDDDGRWTVMDDHGFWMMMDDDRRRWMMTDDDTTALQPCRNHAVTLDLASHGTPVRG